MSTQDAERLAARLDEDERAAKKMITEAQRIQEEVARPEMLGRYVPGWGFWPEITAQYERALADIAAKRHILALYREFAAEFGRQWEDPSRPDGAIVGPGVHAATKVLGEVIAALAGVYEEGEETRAVPEGSDEGQVLRLGDVIRVRDAGGYVFAGRIASVDRHAVPRPDRHNFGVICAPLETDGGS